MLACHPAEEPPSANVVLPAMQHQLPYKRESLTFGFSGFTDGRALLLGSTFLGIVEEPVRPPPVGLGLGLG